MGSKNEGFKMDFSVSKCCQATIRFKPTADAYSIHAWCEKCGHYVFNGRTESLLALWMGDKESVVKNKGYIPSWLEELEKKL